MSVGLNPSTPITKPTPELRRFGEDALGHGWAIVLVAVAGLLAFVVDHLIAAPNLTLIFVLPVVITAARFGWKPALTATIAGVLAFDFFFTVPYYSFRITGSPDIWAATLLLVIAAIVSTVAAQSRRRAIAASKAAERASALHDLAHLVVQTAPASDVARATAQALAKIFAAPAVVLIRRNDELQLASVVGAWPSDDDLAAATWTLDNDKPLRGDSYPFEAAAFDFWPVGPEGAPTIAIGVGGLDRRGERPEDPDRYVELAGAYLAASQAGSAARS